MKKLLILHGALGGAAQFEGLTAQLKENFDVAVLNFEGHGGRPSEKPFSIELFAENVKEELRNRDWSETAVFGYSMGGYVALKLAALEPGRITSILTLGTKFAWSPEIAVKETAMLNPDKIEEKVPKFAQALAQLHAPLNWKEMMHKTADLMRNLGDNPELTSEDFAAITIPVTLLLGSEDTMVTPDETLAVQQQIPGARFTKIEGWQHPIERVNVIELAGKIRSVLG